MTKKTKVIKLAIKKNGKDFDRWIDNAPSTAIDIDKVRDITKKLDHSMVDETAK